MHLVAIMIEVCCVKSHEDAQDVRTADGLSVVLAVTACRCDWSFNESATLESP